MTTYSVKEKKNSKEGFCIRSIGKEELGDSGSPSQAELKFQDHYVCVYYGGVGREIGVKRT